jgi:hypothetical protein
MCVCVNERQFALSVFFFKRCQQRAQSRHVLAETRTIERADALNAFIIDVFEVFVEFFGR